VSYGILAGENWIALPTYKPAQRLFFLRINTMLQGCWNVFHPIYTQQKPVIHRVRHAMSYSFFCISPVEPKAVYEKE